MCHFNSLIIEAALATALPAGKVLAVDRLGFAKYITQRLKEHPKIEIRHEEVTDIPRDSIVILATGPLTSDTLSKALGKITGRQHLHFYDAITPIIYAKSINMNIAFYASRYGKSKD
jgi:methylenetetrahydrofolate--tRNA-(uracil-5-)-methyltransferase